MFKKSNFISTGIVFNLTKNGLVSFFPDVVAVGLLLNYYPVFLQDKSE